MISSISPADLRTLRPNVSAECTRRSQWRSRSGVVPSKARAPSNTQEPSHGAWVHGPMISGLPSSHAPSNHVQDVASVSLNAMMISVQTSLQGMHGNENGARGALRKIILLGNSRVGVEDVA